MASLIVTVASILFFPYPTVCFQCSSQSNPLEICEFMSFFSLKNFQWFPTLLSTQGQILIVADEAACDEASHCLPLLWLSLVTLLQPHWPSSCSLNTSSDMLCGHYFTSFGNIFRFYLIREPFSFFGGRGIVFIKVSWICQGSNLGPYIGKSVHLL